MKIEFAVLDWLTHYKTTDKLKITFSDFLVHKSFTQKSVFVNSVVGGDDSKFL